MLSPFPSPIEAVKGFEIVAQHYPQTIHYNLHAVVDFQGVNGSSAESSKEKQGKTGKK